MSRKSNKTKAASNPAEEAYQTAYRFVHSHPLLAPLAHRTHFWRAEGPGNICPPTGYAVVNSAGYLYIHPKRHATSEEWVFAFAHGLLHLGFGHFAGRDNPDYTWNVACDCVVNSFLAQIKLGHPWPEIAMPAEYLNRTEESLYREFTQNGIPDGLRGIGTGAAGSRDMFWATLVPSRYDPFANLPQPTWQDTFARGLQQSVIAAVDVAAGKATSLLDTSTTQTAAQRARSWFISSYPLLGALAASFTLHEREDLCRRMDISVAAVNEELGEIYINPRCALDEQEWRFVLAHELLHVGLRHQARCQGRDAYLWNVACDYVINGWLVAMQVGAMPTIGLLYDPELTHLSAETVYDRIVTDARRLRKLTTLRGVGLGDVLGDRPPDWWQGDGTDLDEFYRSCLGQGLDYYENGQRGTLPAGLIEEIRALAQPPIPWDVGLARWFDHFFAPLEKHRSYARPSRRQGSTPDIPRPHWVLYEEQLDTRTFGVVLDTSGSMDRNLLAKALGSIASYAIARDVPAVRVVFCDATYYDEGYMPAEAIAERVKVKGRGGTILQPAIDLLQSTPDFPKAAPILIITDGYCDRLIIRREHAFLLPTGANLPFVPRGPVFRVK